MNVFLDVVGVLLLLVSLAAIALGLYMATGAKTRLPGIYFAIWWVPGAAAASGILMKDPVTFVVGVVCFAVAGIAILLHSRVGGGRRPEGGSSSEARDGTDDSDRGRSSTAS